MSMKETEVDLNQVNDGLNGYWWNRIRVRDFCFLESLYTKEKVKLEIGDVLIHKEKKEGEHFPTIRYYIVDEGMVLLLDNKSIKNHLKRELIKFVNEKNLLPFNCSYTKGFKNGNIQVDYSPTKFDNFALTITPEDYPENEDFEYMYKKGLKSAPNPLESGEDGCSYTIKPITFSNLSLIKGVKDKIFVKRGTVEDFNKRREYFQEHHTSFYLVKLKDVEASADDSGEFMARQIPEIIIRLTKVSYLELNLKKGDIVSFAGFFKNDKKYGELVQNIRKVDILK